MKTLLIAALFATVLAVAGCEHIEYALDPWDNPSPGDWPVDHYNASVRYYKQQLAAGKISKAEYDADVKQAKEDFGQ